MTVAPPPATRPNDPAGPIPATGFPEGQLFEEASPGLTKREHFAAQVLAGIVAGPPLPGSPRDPKALADRAVRMADALIDALNG